MQENIEHVDLAEILDIGAIQALMDDFYALARIPMSLIDLQGKVLVGVGWQDVCTQFHRVHSETCRYCLESDTVLTREVPAGECRLYRCKNHMWDMATPLLIGERRVGHIFSGQFFFEDEPIDYERFRTQARRYGFDETQYLAAIDRAPRLSRAAVETGMAFLMKFGRMVSQLGYNHQYLTRTLTEREAVGQVKTLKGILPICASCKKIRDDKGYWEFVESYITKHTDVLFSHGICPGCYEKALTELEGV